MKTKRILALVLCTLMMLASFGMLAGAVETEPTITMNPVGNTDLAFTALVTENTNTTKEAATVVFTAGQAGSFKIKVGVPITGYYNVSALIKGSDYSQYLDTDLVLTTEYGESFTYGRTTRGGSWTYAPANVYLEKGDRILTFSSDMTGVKGIRVNGIRLYHMTKAFYSLGNTSLEIPLGEGSVTVTAGEMFATDIGIKVDSSKVELTAIGATVVKDSADWTKSTITFSEEGTYPVTIKDDFYGGVTGIEVVVEKITAEDLVPDDTEKEPTINTVTTPAMDAAFTALITSTKTVIKGATNATFTAGKPGSFKIKVGVPATGYYNVSALVTASDGTANLDTDLTLTTDRGESFTYNRTTRGGSWTYAPANVYLVKGDRILTFSSNMTGSKGIVMRGIRLYNITKAFYGIKDVEVEIPLNEDSITVYAGDLIATDIGVTDVDSSKVVFTVSTGATISQDMSDWSKSKITFTGEGEYTITIKDDFYGGVTTITVPVTKEAEPLDPDIETTPTLDTVTNPLMYGDMIAQITRQSNVTTEANTTVYFLAGQAGTVKIKVGVPETGYYNVSALLMGSDNTSALDSDLTVTTDRGDSFTYSRTTRGSSWTYAPANVYLVKGDRILTFTSNTVGSKHIVWRAVRLYHVTAAFGTKGDLTYEFGKDEEVAVELTAGDLFEPYIGVTDINSATVELTAPGGAVAVNTSDWTQSTITFTDTGKYEVNIKDDFFGKVVTVNVVIAREPSLKVSEFRMLSKDGIRIPYAINNHLTPYANVTITKLKDDVQKAYIVFAEYSDDNKLMGINMQPVDITTMALNESKNYALPLSLKGESGEVKAFVLGEDFEPIAEAGGYASEDIFTKEMLNKEVTYQLATETLDPNGNYYTEPGLHNDQYDIDAIFYDGSVYNGRQTKVFAFMGIPKNATAENPVPAVVCVHGGWGKAEASWVKKWNDRGYAAISMDLYGNGPVSGTNTPDDHTGRLAHPYKGMYPWDDYGTAFLKDYDHAGMYHVVQNVINAHSLIRSLDKVDASRTGITGISWGGITTTIVSGVDDRFKFAAPVYGCGYLDEAVTYFQTAFDGDTKTDKWDPSNFAAAAKMPVLYTNSDIDVHFSINSSSLTYENTPNAYLSIRHGLGHSQGAGDSIEQVYDFAEKIFGGNTQPFMTIENETFANNVLTFDYTAPAGTTVSSVNTYYITNEKLPAGGGEAFVWSGVSAYTNSNGKISVTLPEAATFCYASVTDSEGNIISTKLMAK